VGAAATSWSRISAASWALGASSAARISRNRSSSVSTVPERSASRNLEGASSGKTSDRPRSAPSGRSRRVRAYNTETTTVAARLMPSHHARNIWRELVGTPVIAVANRTNASDPAIGSA
jgi:hypothetical protein